MKDLDDFARAMGSLPAELQRAQVKGVRAAALYVTTGIRGEIRATTGDMRLSGVGRRGARVGAKYDVRGQVNPSAIIRATGPLHLVEHPTAPHVIPRQNRRRKGILKFPDGRFARWAHHPGTSPSRPFERGFLKTREATGRIFDLQVQGAIRAVLR